MFAPGKAIESSLKNLAERRTDIFGVGEDAATEAEIGKKLGDDTEDEAVHQIENPDIPRDNNTLSGEAVEGEDFEDVPFDEDIEEGHEHQRDLVDSYSNINN